MLGFLVLDLLYMYYNIIIILPICRMRILWNILKYKSSSLTGRNLQYIVSNLYLNLLSYKVHWLSFDAYLKKYELYNIYIYIYIYCIQLYKSSYMYKHPLKSWNTRLLYPEFIICSFLLKSIFIDKVLW